MKSFLLIFLSLITLTVFGQQPEYSDSGFTNKAEAKNLTVNGKKEGKWIEYVRGYADVSYSSDSSGATGYRLVIYRHGVLVGIERSYYMSGKIWTKRLWVNDIINGYGVEYYENGKLKTEEYYSMGTLNGIYKEYYEDGRIKSETPWDNGKENGTIRAYYPNGQLENEIPMNNNSFDGGVKNYYENGNLKSVTTYTKGRLDGPHKEYYESGKLKTDFNWSIKDYTGVDKEYFENGIISHEIPFERNKRNGTEKWYYENGKLKSAIVFKNNKQDKIVNYDENENEIKSMPLDVPSTAVYLLEIQKKGEGFNVVDEFYASVSNTEWYNNQPVFIEKLNSIAYAGSLNDGPTDIYLYNLATKETKQFTNNSEAEYSPKLTPDGKYISMVKGTEQNLTKVSLDGKVTEKIYTCKDSIGYYCWVNENEIAAVVLTKPVSLKLINIIKGTEQFLGDSVGRSLFIYDSLIVHSEISSKGNYIVFSDTMGNSKDPIDLPAGTEDFYITEDGWIFSSNGSSIVYCNSKNIKKGWQVLIDLKADLKKMGIHKISRISVNKNENKLAFVAE